jgi:hypothetical protein
MVTSWVKNLSKASAYIGCTTIIVLTTLLASEKSLARTNELNQDQRFLLAVRSLSTQSNVKILRIEAEVKDATSRTLSQSSWRVSATGPAPHIIQWSNLLLKEFPACNMKQMELKRAGAHIKDFDATMTWVCIELVKK